MREREEKAKQESIETLKEPKIAGVRRTERHTHAAIVTMRIRIGVIVVTFLIGRILSLAAGVGFTSFGDAFFAIVVSKSGHRAHERTSVAAD